MRWALAALSLAIVIAEAAACPQPNTLVEIASVDDGAQLLLSDGRTLVMPGLDIADLPKAASAIRAWLGGNVAKITLLSDSVDRWGRWPAVVAPAEAPESVALAEELVLSGLAVYRPDSIARPCRRALLSAENLARHAKRGIWSDGSAFNAVDTVRLRAQSPSLTIIEGKVVSVGRVADRVYLNFSDASLYFGSARSGQSGPATVTFLGKNLKLKENMGFTEVELIGRIVRARGLLDRRFGLSLEISSVDAFELVEEGM